MTVTGFQSVFGYVSFAPMTNEGRLHFSYVAAQLRSVGCLCYSNEGTGLMVSDKWVLSQQSSKPTAQAAKNIRFRYMVLSSDQTTVYREFRSLSKAIAFAKQGAK